MFCLGFGFYGYWFFYLKIIMKVLGKGRNKIGIFKFYF